MLRPHNSDAPLVRASLGLFAVPKLAVGVQPLRGRWREQLKQLAGLAASTAAVALSVVLHTSGGEDDKYISYFSAWALAEHGVIANYNGAAVEQSSSLSLVVALAAAYKLLPLSMPALGYLAGLVFAALTLVLASRIARQTGTQRSLWVGPMIGTVACFSYWSTSGMETTLVTASGLWLVLELQGVYRESFVRRSWVAVLAALVFAGARPESPFIAVGVALGFAAASVAAWRPGGAPLRSVLAGALRVLGCVTLGAALPVAFRRLYFGAWVPNPAAMKAGGFDLDEGARYLWNALAQSGPVLLAFALTAVYAVVRSIVRGRAYPPATVLLVGLALGQLAFAVASGGDWMGAGRFLAPAVPPLVLAAWLLAPAVRHSAVIAGILCLNVVGLFRFLERGEGSGRPLWTARGLGRALSEHVGSHSFSAPELGNKLHLRDAVTLSRLLPLADRVVRAEQRPISVMTGQAGMLGYHLATRHYGHVKLIDLWSLTTRELFECFEPGSLRSSRWGTLIDLEPALEKTSGGGSSCSVRPPDIYYNECLTAEARKALERHGYVIVYEQTGSVQNHDRLFRGSLAACGHFAVKKELVEKLGLSVLPSYEWDLRPRR